MESTLENEHKSPTAATSSGPGPLKPRRGIQSCLAAFYRTFAGILADRAFVIYMLAIILLGWGFELSNFTMTLDDEVVLFRPEGTEWIEQGRWTMCVLDTIFGNVSAPVIPLAMTLAMHAMSFCILFGGLRRREKFYIFPIYAVFPTLFHSFSYSALNPGIGLGFLLTAAAARLVFARGLAAAAVGAILGAAAIGIYQIFLVFAAAALLACWIQRALRDGRCASFRAIRHYALRALSVFAGAVVIYKGVQECFKRLTGCGADNYINGYVGLVTTIDGAKLWLHLMGAKVRQYLFGSPVAFPIRMYAYAALVVVAAAILLVWLLAGRQRRPARFAVAAATLLAIALPFAPDILNCYAAFPCRVITIVFPLSVATLAFVALRLTDRNRCGGAVVKTLVVASVVQFLWAINQEVFTNILRFRRDAAFALEVKSRIDALPEAVAIESSGLPIPISVVGRVPRDVRLGPVPNEGVWPDWTMDMVGISGFAYAFRTGAALRIHTGAYFNFIEIGDPSPELGRFIENMPVWPLNGSVGYCGATFLVKFGDYLPPGFPDVDGPSARRCTFRQDMRTPVNGFDELVYTIPKKENLIYSFSTDDLLPPVSHTRTRDIRDNGGCMALEIIGADPWIYLKPFHSGEPFLIVELLLDMDRGDEIGLWEDLPSQCCRFRMDAGEGALRVRVPAHFLARPFRIDLGGGAARRITAKGVNIYADRDFTERLYRLNPGMNGAPVN